MRSKWDRLRHTLGYEVFLLLIATPVLSFILKESAVKMGGIGIMFSLVAMGWNYTYNMAFDKILLALKHPLYPRGFFIRTIHAVCFELGFMSISIPVVMIILGYPFLKVLTMNIGFLIGVPVYTFLYNWTYDHLFPVSVA